MRQYLNIGLEISLHLHEVLELKISILANRIAYLKVLKERP
jgi:hypothetical protein